MKHKLSDKQYPDFSQLTIKEVKVFLTEKTVAAEYSKLITLLNQDSRQGIKKLAKKLNKQLIKKEKLLNKWEKMNLLIKKFQDQGYNSIVGIDEAGRGPLAGPVVAAAVILDLNQPIYGLDDSKQLSQSRREELFIEIKEKALIGVGQASNLEIDKYNIREATFVAMKRAVKDLLPNLECNPDLLLIDGNAVIPGISVEQQAVINGDAKVNTIAAASIIAKVTRDNLIFEYAKKYPEYNLASNKGYGTAEHIAALNKYGATPIHRQTFAKVPLGKIRKDELNED